MTGRLFSFEGMDGVGKSTQVARAAEWLAATGYRVLVVREPGGTPLGESLREILLHQDLKRGPLAEFLLFLSARAELVSVQIRPWLAQGGVILADRYVDSSVAYQGFGAGVDLGLIESLNAKVSAGALPAGTLWFDGPPRLHQNEARDNVESRGSDFFERVLEGYRWLWHEHPQRIQRIDAHHHPDEVFLSVRQSLSQWLSAGQA